MSQSNLPPDRTFFCDHCDGEIRIAYELPPTTAPCPLCGKEITSPPPPAPDPRPFAPPAPLVPLTEVESAEDLHLDPLVKKPEAGSVSSPGSAVPGGATSASVRESSATAVATMEPPAPKSAPAEHARADAQPQAPAGVPDTDADHPADLGTRLRNINPLLAFVGVIVLIVALLVAAILMNRDRTPAGKGGANRSAVERSRFLREGWRQAASQRLAAFIGATTPEERAKHVIGGADRTEDIRAFYSEDNFSENDTPLSAFSHFDLGDENKERGIFMMRYERPAQFDMREFFRPVAPLDIQYRLEEPDLLLSAFASLENFSMEPVRVMAFFKQSGDDLFLDWDVYAQTKYRTLRDFASYPQPGVARLFRVIVNEDVADSGTPNQDKVRYYRFSDPAQSSDYVKLPVQVESKSGQILQSLNWIGMSGRGVPSQTATVQLAWTEGRSPWMELREIVCWEFVGLGGVEGNAIPGEKYEPVPKAAAEPPATPPTPAADGATAGEQ